MKNQLLSEKQLVWWLDIPSLKTRGKHSNENSRTVDVPDFALPPTVLESDPIPKTSSDLILSK